MVNWVKNRLPRGYIILPNWVHKALPKNDILVIAAYRTKSMVIKVITGFFGYLPGSVKPNFGVTA